MRHVRDGHRQLEEYVRLLMGGYISFMGHDQVTYLNIQVITTKNLYLEYGQVLWEAGLSCVEHSPFHYLDD